MSSFYPLFFRSLPPLLREFRVHRNFENEFTTPKKTLKFFSYIQEFFYTRRENWEKKSKFPLRSFTRRFASNFRVQNRWIEYRPTFSFSLECTLDVECVFFLITWGRKLRKKEKKRSSVCDKSYLEATSVEFWLLEGERCTRVSLNNARLISSWRLLSTIEMSTARTLE